MATATLTRPTTLDNAQGVRATVRQDGGTFAVDCATFSHEDYVYGDYIETWMSDTFDGFATREDAYEFASSWVG